MGVIFPIATALSGVYAQNRALEQQAAANALTSKGMIQSMNYSLANLEQERRSSFEATVDEIAQTRLQALRLQSSVDAAVNENIVGGGRTAALIKRSVANDAARTISSIKGSFANKTNEIDLNKEQTMLNAKNQINSIPQVKAPNFLTTALGVTGDYYNYKNTIESIHANRQQKGVKIKGGR